MDEVDIGGHYNSTLEQGQCFVLTVLTLPQTAPERMSNVGHSQAAIGQSRGGAHSRAHHLYHTQAFFGQFSQLQSAPKTYLTSF